jgi:hypothetical protein
VLLPGRVEAGMTSLLLGIAIGFFLGIASVFVAIIWTYRKGVGGV